MAKIVEDMVVIKFSKLIRDGEEHTAALVSADLHQALEQVAQELVGDAVIVEVMGSQVQ